MREKNSLRNHSFSTFWTCVIFEMRNFSSSSSLSFSNNNNNNLLQRTQIIEISHLSHNPINWFWYLIRFSIGSGLVWIRSNHLIFASMIRLALHLSHNKNSINCVERFRYLIRFSIGSDLAWSGFDRIVWFLLLWFL